MSNSYFLHVDKMGLLLEKSHTLGSLGAVIILGFIVRRELTSRTITMEAGMLC